MSLDKTADVEIPLEHRGFRGKVAGLRTVLPISFLKSSGALRRDLSTGEVVPLSSGGSGAEGPDFSAYRLYINRGLVREVK